MNKKQVIRINENQLRQIVLEGVGDEYLDNNDKRYDRTIRFDGVKDNQDALDRANADRLIHHRKSRGVKTKGDLSDRDFWRRQTEKGNPLIKYKRNPKEWLDNLLSQTEEIENNQETNENKIMNKKQVIRLNERQLRQIVTESVKRVLKENEYSDNESPFYVAADVNSDFFDTYQEAYEYAMKLAKKETDWHEPIFILDYPNWEKITIFDEDGVTDLRS